MEKKNLCKKKTFFIYIKYKEFSQIQWLWWFVCFLYLTLSLFICWLCSHLFIRIWKSFLIKHGRIMKPNCKHLLSSIFESKKKYKNVIVTDWSVKTTLNHIKLKPWTFMKPSVIGYLWYIPVPYRKETHSDQSCNNCRLVYLNLAYRGRGGCTT